MIKKIRRLPAHLSRLLLVAWPMLLFIGCSSQKVLTNTSDPKVNEVVELLRQAPYWLDLDKLPWEPPSAAVQGKLYMLASFYAAIANHDTDVIRKAAHAYMDGASGDQKVLKNSNLLVLNRYLFNIERPESYPVDSSEGELNILPSSPIIIGPPDPDALEEFDSFAEKYERRPVTKLVPNPKAFHLTVLDGDNQSALPSATNGRPFSIAVWQNGPVANMPVTFTITTPDGGSLLGSPAAEGASSLTLKSDADGTVRVYFKQPVVSGVESVRLRPTGKPSRYTVTALGCISEYKTGISVSRSVNFR